MKMVIFTTSITQGMGFTFLHNALLNDIFKLPTEFQELETGTLDVICFAIMKIFKKSFN